MFHKISLPYQIGDSTLQYFQDNKPSWSSEKYIQWTWIRAFVLKKQNRDHLEHILMEFNAILGSTARRKNQDGCPAPCCWKDTVTVRPSDWAHWPPLASCSPEYLNWGCCSSGGRWRTAHSLKKRCRRAPAQPCCSALEFPASSGGFLWGFEGTHHLCWVDRSILFPVTHRCLLLHSVCFEAVGSQNLARYGLLPVLVFEMAAGIAELADSVGPVETGCWLGHWVEESPDQKRSVEGGCFHFPLWWPCWDLGWPAVGQPHY